MKKDESSHSLIVKEVKEKRRTASPWLERMITPCAPAWRHHETYFDNGFNDKENMLL